MNSALWLLMKLRLKGWGRRIVRTVRTDKGAIVTGLFAVMLLFWLGSMLVSLVAARNAPQVAAPPEYVERFAPLFLLFYCLSMIATSGSHTPFVFSPAEVQYLFTGPFTRRQLLTYKILTQFLLTLPFTVFMAIGVRSLSGTFFSGFVATVLTFVFMQLFGLCVSLVSCSVGELIFSRFRKAVLWGTLIALIAAAVYAFRAGGFTGNGVDLMKQLEQTDVVQYLLAPLRWFVKVLTARAWDAEFFRYCGQALAVDLGLLGLIFTLDAKYMEQAASNSEKRYARLQKMRSGGLAGLSASRAGKPRVFLPPLPRWGGVGTIAWRQMIAALRSERLLGILLFATAMGAIGPIIAAVTTNKEDNQGLAYSLAGMAFFMSTMLGQAIAFDFRADVDRIEVLKSLPISAWKIAVGQLVTPVLYSSLYQIFLIAVLQFTLGHLETVLAFTIVLVWPINLLLTGVDNWLFLLFPARMGPATPGDFSQAGRHMLLMLGKLAALALGLGFPAVFAVAAYYLTGENWAATIIAAFVPAIIMCALPIPLVALAFKNFDVARDTPP